MFWAWRRRRHQHMTHVELAAKPFSDTSSMSTDPYMLKGGTQVDICVKVRIRFMIEGLRPGLGLGLEAVHFPTVTHRTPTRVFPQNARHCAIAHRCDCICICCGSKDAIAHALNLASCPFE